MISTSIYKYFGPERIDVLRFGQIAYTPPIRFNDPFDMSPAVDIDVSDEALDMDCDLFQNDFPPNSRTATELETIRAGYKDVMKDKKLGINHELQAEFLKIANSVGVFCCTDLENDMLMWSHYANHHEGFVVEFDLTHRFFEDRMHVVSYEANRPKLSHWNNIQTEIGSLVLTKSIKWKQEREWRSIEQLINCSPKQCMGKDGSAITVYLHAYPKEAVKRVICGCRMSTQNKEILRTQMLSWGFAGIRLEELFMHPQHYEFERRLIELSTEGL